MNCYRTGQQQGWPLIQGSSFWLGRLFPSCTAAAEAKLPWEVRRDWAAFPACRLRENFPKWLPQRREGRNRECGLSLAWGGGRGRAWTGRACKPRGWAPASGFSFGSLLAVGMAEGREGSGAAGSLEDELICDICLGLYLEPMSLICGHSFCRQCLEELMASRRLRSCPTCRAKLGSTPLTKNFALASIVEAFRATASKGQGARRESFQQEEGAGKEQTGVVRCEHCLDRPQPAVKTCLVCEASLCQTHLDKHNAKGFHQEHIMVDVGAGKVEERLCQDHGKLLECYCLKEEKCICVLCSISGAHKGHRVITMKERRDQQLAKISDIMTELQEYKGYLVTAREKIQESENQFKRNTNRLTSQLEELFKNIKTELDEKRIRILRHIQSCEGENLARIANRRENVEHKRDQAEQSLQDLQKIKEQPDLFLFFKDLEQVTDRIASLDLGAERVIVEKVQLDQRMLTQYETQKKDLMQQLDSLLKDVRDHIQYSISEVSVRGKVGEGGTKYILS